ncbi:hypothetical protein Tco_0018894 [Tanacetum coccineum]
MKKLKILKKNIKFRGGLLGLKAFLKLLLLRSIKVGLTPSDAKAPIKDQPLPDDASPTSLSSSYVADSDLEEDPEEDPVDYPVDGGDDDDDFSEDDADDEDEEEAYEEEDVDDEEEHLAPPESSVVPCVNPVPSVEDTYAFETDESAPTPPSPRPRRAGISIRLPPPIAASIEAPIVEYAAAPTLPSPPPSPLTPLSSLLP